MKDNLGMLPLTASTSAFVWAAVVLLSFHAIVKGIKGSQKQVNLFTESDKYHEGTVGN